MSVSLALAILMGGCKLIRSTPTPQPTPPDPLREIVILHTNDEHGYLLHEESNGFASGGADLAAALWAQRDHDPLSADGKVLLLSGGDNWTGPAISTWFAGESTVEVMNAMGYRASVPGNHEFDFGQQALQERLSEAQFPYLAANVYEADTDELSDLFEPYTIISVNDVQMGVIGLALETTPNVTAAKGIAGLRFGPYEPALREWVPRVRAAGAQVIVVETHICDQELLRLASDVKDLDIALLQGGHCHRSLIDRVGETLVASGSSGWRDYVLTRLIVDVASGEIVASEQTLEEVRAPSGDRIPAAPEPVAQAVTKWYERVDIVLGEVIGYTATGIPQHDTQMHNLLVDAWLWAYPGAELAISNTGGFREEIAPGEITIQALVGVLPFDNDLLEIEASGAQIIQALRSSQEALVLGGARLQGNELILADGTTALPDQSYRLLVIDYLYDNAKYPFSSYDEQPYETSIHWRQPAIDWIKAQRTSRARPLEQLLDDTERLP